MKRRISGPSSIRSFFDSVGSGSSSACLQRREPRAYFCLLPDLMWKPGWYRSWGHGSCRLCSWEAPARPCHLQDFSSSCHRENASPGRVLSITWNIVAKSITKICLMGAAFFHPWIPPRLCTEDWRRECPNQQFLWKSTSRRVLLFIHSFTEQILNCVRFWDSGVNMMSSMPPWSVYPNSVEDTERHLWSFSRGRGFNLILREEGSGVEIHLEDDFCVAKWLVSSHVVCLFGVGGEEKADGDCQVAPSPNITLSQHQRLSNLFNHSFNQSLG